MKWLSIFCGLIIFAFLAPLAAQETSSADWDIDSLFDEPPPDAAAEETVAGEGEPLTVLNLVKQRGFTFNAAYEFYGGLAPGWDHTPWTPNVDKTFSWVPGVKLKATFGLDVQISEVFRVKNNIIFDIPNANFFKFGDFFFDYNFYNAVFVRGGKYGLTWGISPNYGFTNLLARLPPNTSGGESFILKADIPIGVGGIQLLTQTRAKLMSGVVPELRDFGVGGKYNLALRWADIDAGAYYQSGMPLRGFLSIKTTIGNTELYHEWMAAVIVKEPEKANGAANLGFARDFFGGKLTLNGELLFNAEENAWWYRPETIVKEAGSSPFISGLSGAMNVIYRLGGRGDPRLFTQFLYAPMENSARLVPGFRLNPWQHIEFSLAVPMALGSRDGYYYKHTADSKNRPFSIMMLLSLNGSFQFGRYF